MNGIRKSVAGKGTKRLEVSVESAGVLEQQMPVQRGLADLRMENIKEFIRNIDVKSL
ncbi:MAG: hypothetical protein P4L43_07770 [Syntrophobacteraceae bacterium]|nr:hypothetical protein [Syntrophobacteraceae bacterium]